jgi:glucose dehydrogenase
MQQGEWLTITGDRGSTKYSSLDQIDATNVDQLNVAWRSPSPQNPLRFSVGA